MLNPSIMLAQRLRALRPIARIVREKLYIRVLRSRRDDLTLLSSRYCYRFDLPPMASSTDSMQRTLRLRHAHQSNILGPDERPTIAARLESPVAMDAAAAFGCEDVLLG
jgi:hypothetical protein